MRIKIVETRWKKATERLKLFYGLKLFCSAIWSPSLTKVWYSVPAASLFVSRLSIVVANEENTNFLDIFPNIIQFPENNIGLIYFLAPWLDTYAEKVKLCLKNYIHITVRWIKTYHFEFSYNSRFRDVIREITIAKARERRNACECPYQVLLYRITDIYPIYNDVVEQCTIYLLISRRNPFGSFILCLVSTSFLPARLTLLSVISVKSCRRREPSHPSVKGYEYRL